MKKPPKPIVKKLASDFKWDIPDGFKLLVVNRGDAVFNIPNTWVVTDMEPFTVRDAAVPDDEMGILATLMPMPRGVDFSQLSLPDLLKQSAHDSGDKSTIRSDIFTSPRADLQMVWTEHRFMDKKEKREAYSRYVLARRDHIHILITFVYWVSDVEIAMPVWDELVRSLQLGLVLQDPSVPRKLH